MAETTPPAEDNKPGASADELRTRRWNYRQMRRELHVPALQARLLAEKGVSWHDVAQLVGKGCDPDLAARILV